MPRLRTGGRRIGDQYSHLLHRLFERAGHLKFSPAAYFPCHVSLARNSSAPAPMTSTGSPVQVLARLQEDHLPLKAFSISSIGYEAGHAMTLPPRTSDNAFTHRAQIDKRRRRRACGAEGPIRQGPQGKLGLLQRAPNAVPGCFRRRTVGEPAGCAGCPPRRAACCSPRRHSSSGGTTGSRTS